MRFSAIAFAALLGLVAAETAEIKMDVDELIIETTKKVEGCTRLTRNGDVLRVNYKGELMNGKVFDDSWGREPLQFQMGVGMVIKGWEEGLQGMCEGEIRKITIPSKMAYGTRGAGGGLIPPNSALVFVCELMEIVVLPPPEPESESQAEPAATEAEAEPEPAATETPAAEEAPVKDEL
ncbi:hypothetical protein ABW19_dt0204537 [Dactylella cylindrospora]|nr:hypothetical protein ABW19_dt0204537 [Dactylella cylindrospora]